VGQLVFDMAVAITEESTVCLPSLQPLWHRKAPRRLIENCPADSPSSGWNFWQEHLRTRKSPRVPPFAKRKISALLWGWPAAWEYDTLRATINSPTTLAEAAIGDDAASLPDLPFSLQLVALAYALPQLAAELPAETWWYVAEKLHAVATQAHTPRVDWRTNSPDLIRNQLLAGELPLALGYLFPEIRALHALRNDARTVLSEALIDVTDGRGLPHARLLPVLGPLLACWTRTRWLGARLRRGPWSREAELQYQWLVRQVIRLADKRGRFVLDLAHREETADDDQGGKSWNKQLMKMAIDLAGDNGDYAAAAEAMPCLRLTTIRYAKDDRPEPSLNSEWSGMSVMADGWSQSDMRLAAAYADHPMSIELSLDGQRLLVGTWTSSTICDGKAVHAIGEWEQLCWECGKRFNFLELGLQLSDGLRLERQLLFARDDRLLYLADMIISGDAATRNLQHSFGLPLGPEARWLPENETRDGVLRNRSVRAAVLPLALREWRDDPRGGTLEESGRRLVLSQAASGRAICCPLLLDLDRRRSKKERTWRQLTVAEEMDIVPRDIAVGFRAQSGGKQWLFYRSLGKAGNRTVLGQNIAGEFSAGRFLPTGQLKEWVEIEAV
jgi:hypothetical protein